MFKAFSHAAIAPSTNFAICDRKAAGALRLIPDREHAS
jgi:hypothetical protein